MLAACSSSCGCFFLTCLDLFLACASKPIVATFFQTRPFHLQRHVATSSLIFYSLGSSLRLDPRHRPGLLLLGRHATPVKASVIAVFQYRPEPGLMRRRAFAAGRATSLSAMGNMFMLTILLHRKSAPGYLGLRSSILKSGRVAVMGLCCSRPGGSAHRPRSRGAHVQGALCSHSLPAGRRTYAVDRPWNRELHWCSHFQRKGTHDGEAAKEAGRTGRLKFGWTPILSALGLDAFRLLTGSRRTAARAFSSRGHLTQGRRLGRRLSKDLSERARALALYSMGRRADTLQPGHGPPVTFQANRRAASGRALGLCGALLSGGDEMAMTRRDVAFSGPWPRAYAPRKPCWRPRRPAIETHFEFTTFELLRLFDAWRRRRRIPGLASIQHEPC